VSSATFGGRALSLILTYWAQCPFFGTKRTSQVHSPRSASLIGRSGSSTFRLSTLQCVDVARGLALLFGLGTKALPVWDSKTRWNNLWVDLAVTLTAGSSGRANSPHPSSREGHHSTTQWSSSFLLIIDWTYSHAAATSLVQRNSVPST